MGNFNRDRTSSGGRSFGRTSDRPMHKTVCSKCGKQCEVPFIPSGSRPVFCRDCFQNNRSSTPMRPDNNYPNRPVEQPQYREQFEALNAKLDRILKILEPKIAAPIVSEETPKIKKSAKKPSSPKKK